MTFQEQSRILLVPARAAVIPLHFWGHLENRWYSSICSSICVDVGRQFLPVQIELLKHIPNSFLLDNINLETGEVDQAVVVLYAMHNVAL